MNMLRRSVSCLFTWLVLFIASCGVASAQEDVTRHVRSATVPLVPQFAIADFDGDQKPDVATVRIGTGGSDRALYLIDFRLSTGFRQTFGLTASAGGLRLASRDVNGDDLLDVVVTTSLADEPVAIFLNDGRGNFTQKEPDAFPSAFRRDESSVAAALEADADRTAAETSTSPSATSAISGRFDFARRHFAHLPRTFVEALAKADKEAWLGRAPPLNR